MTLGCDPLSFQPVRPANQFSIRGTCGSSATVNGCRRTTHSCGVARAAAPGNGSSHRPPSNSIPPIPTAVHEALIAARHSWLDRCVDTPLLDPATNSRVHVYGNVHYAPLGGADGLAELRELVARVQPTVLAIEQPYDLSARAGLPYPEVIHQFVALLPDGAELLAGRGDDEAAVAAAAAEAERLRVLLPGLAHPARVGRDLLDPFEVFGLYGGCDYVTRPGQLSEALTLFGHLPGLEYAALAVAAQEQGVQVYSVDAPLRLQEKWVAQLLADFTLGEADLSRRLQHDLARAQALLPEQYLSWDAALAEVVRCMELERLENQQAQGRGGRDGGIDSADGPSVSTITAFKVSRAIAAATLPYEASREAFALQANLQPLKFAVFARRARHLVLQVRDLCQRMSLRHVRVDAEALKGAALGGGPGTGSSGDGGTAQVAFADAAAQPAKVVLAVVGRQYVPYIEEMWANERSALWHGDVPRTFSPSKLDQRDPP